MSSHGTASGAVFFVLHQACSGNFSVTVKYLLTDGAFRKDLVIETSTGLPDLRASLFTPPSDCDGYLYIPFVAQAPKTGFETDPQDRIVPVSDTGVTGFQSSYLTVPDSIGGLTGQGALGLLSLQWVAAKRPQRLACRYCPRHHLQLFLIVLWHCER